ncbi:beta-lactamase family protein [Microbispora sp. SCL1-1]|uniref:serine hydrolase domain-containing protein n=1 Tax=unclassified Microbispora TaxID=2614687 RepID=UPI0011598575|nr:MULTISPECIES: serine hydrolase domain-containing protein [unclassified Microbispora]NJP23776.1 beta-lactamase family protein [Microbispora sp. CL1-1]TQS15310.1 beta-lactamase family protein [Microbispora sp. SCL1-1]
MISESFSASRRDALRLLAGGAAAGLAAGLPASPASAAARTWRVTGSGATSLKPFDDTLKSFMQARTIPHASLAVARKGKLVLARGYNWTADTSFSAGPTSLFRIASLSKPITAAAVLKLVQDGKLSLTAKVAPLLGLSTAADPRLASVTVTHLLQHLGGWDSEVSGDPMFSDRTIAAKFGVPLPVTQAHIIQYVTGRKLDHAPGTTYAYSNYEYLLLQKVIEKASGVSYASYVQSKILTPLKIKRMTLGRTAKSLRKSGEVPYFSKYTGTSVIDTSGSVLPYPYGGFNLENMAAHGGWLATAVDLAKFTTLFDAAGVLTSASISKAFAKPSIGINSNGWYYGPGWQVRPVTGGRNTWHTGSLAGTSTLMVRRYDGLSWVVLFDQRDDASGLGYGDIDSLLHTAANSVKSWPTTDLFSTYGL